jgi:sugar (pentulose or hexulose) kinase
MLAAARAGPHPDLDAAAAAMVRPAGEIEPEPRAAEAYARMRPLFDELHAARAPSREALDRRPAPAVAAGRA